MIKQCKKCNEQFPVDNFHKNKFSKDGYHSYCKSCRKINDYRYPKKVHLDEETHSKLKGLSKLLKLNMQDLLTWVVMSSDFEFDFNTLKNKNSTDYAVHLSDAAHEKLFKLRDKYSLRVCDYIACMLTGNMDDIVNRAFKWRQENE